MFLTLAEKILLRAGVTADLDPPADLDPRSISAGGFGPGGPNLGESKSAGTPASRALNRIEGNELLNNWLSRLCHSFHRTPFQTSSKQSPASFIAIVFV